MGRYEETAFQPPHPCAMPKVTLLHYRYRSNEDNKTEAAVIFTGEPSGGIDYFAVSLKLLLLTPFRDSFVATDVGLRDVSPPPAERIPEIDHEHHEFVAAEMVDEGAKVPVYTVLDSRTPDEFLSDFRKAVGQSNPSEGSARPNKAA